MKIWIKTGLVACGLFLGAASVGAGDKDAARGLVSVSPGEQGIRLSAGRMGTFEISYPVLHAGLVLKPVETRIKGDRVFLRYDNGARLEVVAGSGKLVLSFPEMPPDVKAFEISMLIPFHFNNGGSWKIGEHQDLFPPIKPANPHLFQGHARVFEMISVDARYLYFGLPENAYQQLTDNRAWQWDIFKWSFKVPYNRDHKQETVTISLDAAPARSVILVDKFGQDFRRDFPGKIHDENELKADVGQDDAYYAGLGLTTSRDRFCGLAGSGRTLDLARTGFFHVEKRQRAGREAWVLVDPDGNAFFHLGICGFGPSEDFTCVEGRSDAYEWLPPRQGDFSKAWHPESYWSTRAVSFYKANVIRKFGVPFDDDANQRRMVERVRRLGFNSVGAFTGESPVFREKEFPRVKGLPLGAQVGPELPGLRGVFDPFDEKIRDKMDALFEKSVAASADDPLIIGYFLANEQGFEDIPRAIPALKGNYAAKRRLIELLRAGYPDIGAFNTAWAMQAESFEALVNQGLPLTTKAAFADMQTYTELFLETYYRTITETFRKYDRNHMLMGNRWQPGTANSEVLCRVAGKYMDIISINYYASSIDEPFIRRLYGWTGGKPQLWSEFYFTSERESTVKGRGSDLATQRERGLAYRHYVEAAAALGFVVGVEWFTLIDQAVSGRFFEKYNGERNNTGLFNVADRPYKSMLAEMVKSHEVIYDVWLEGQAPYVFDDPRFKPGPAKACRSVSAGHATGPMLIDGRLDGWPGRPPELIGASQLVLGRGSDGVEASFKVCWDEENLYLLANVTDSTPMMNEATGGSLWCGDGLEVFLGGENLGQGGALQFTDRQILLGGARDNQFHVVNAATQPAIRTVVVPVVDGHGYTLEAAIPWPVLSVGPKVRTELLFDVAVDNSRDGRERSGQLVWNGGTRNSSDRSGWGRLVLVP